MLNSSSSSTIQYKKKKKIIILYKRFRIIEFLYILFILIIYNLLIDIIKKIINLFKYKIKITFYNRLKEKITI